MGDGRHVAELVGRASGALVVVWHQPGPSGAWVTAGESLGPQQEELPGSVVGSLEGQDELVAQVLRFGIVTTGPNDGLLTPHEDRLRALFDRLESGVFVGVCVEPAVPVIIWIGLPNPIDTERLEAVRELLKLVERVDRQLVQYRRLEAVDRMVSGVAHELNNPLQTVVGNAEMLSGMKLPDSAARRARRVLAGARRCQEVVEGLLKLKRRRRDLSQAVTLEEMVRRTVRRMEAEFRGLIPERPAGARGSRSAPTGARGPAHEFSDRRFATRVQIVDPLPTVRGDEADLEHALENVVRNAFQAVVRKAGGEVAITLRGVDRSVEITVQDDGGGMPPETLERAFEPFFTTRGVGAGKGLGLSVALGIVEEHGGIIEIQLHSAGTRVVISLPGAE